MSASSNSKAFVATSSIATFAPVRTFCNTKAASSASTVPLPSASPLTGLLGSGVGTSVVDSVVLSVVVSVVDSVVLSVVVSVVLSVVVSVLVTVVVSVLVSVVVSVVLSVLVSVVVSPPLYGTPTTGLETTKFLSVSFVAVIL